MTATAAPTKLRDGSWGAKIGDKIIVTDRNGKTWTATVVRVLQTGGHVAIVDHVAIVATVEDAQADARYARYAYQKALDAYQKGDPS